MFIQSQPKLLALTNTSRQKNNNFISDKLWLWAGQTFFLINKMTPSGMFFQIFQPKNQQLLKKSFD